MVLIATRMPARKTEAMRAVEAAREAAVFQGDVGRFDVDGGVAPGLAGHVVRTGLGFAPEALVLCGKDDEKECEVILMRPGNILLTWIGAVDGDEAPEAMRETVRGLIKAALPREAAKAE